ncbi:MAG: LptF/LptG family permease [Acidobacteria bacterium]|nr:LptF/LptG family permease [Acidobacteriota bacterium]
MGILFRYVFREVVVSTLIGTLLFTFVLFLQNISRVMELLIGPNVSGRQTLYLFLLMVPQTLVFTIPVGVLVGVLVGLGRMSTDGEITAIRAAGIPGRRLVRPIAVWAVLAALVSGATSHYWNPWAQRELQAVQQKLKISQATAQVQPRVFIESFPNYVLYVGDVVPGDTVQWRHVFIADTRDPAKRGSFSGVDATVSGPRITLAAQATAIPILDQNRVQLNMPHASTYEQSYNPDNYQTIDFDNIDQVLEFASEQPRAGAGPLEQMTTGQLLTALSLDDQRVAAGIEFHKRLAFPLTCLIFPMIGIPLAISSQRSSRSVGVVFGLVLVFVYWMIWLGGVALASADVLPVGPALWIGNVLFGIAGFWMLLRLDSPNRRDWAALLLSPVRRSAARFRSRVAPVNDVPAESPEDERREQAKDEDASSSQPIFPIVDRYLLSSFLYYFAIMLASFVLIWFVFSFFELLGDMLERHKLGLFIPYIYYLTPFLFYETAPLAVLVATLITFFVMAKHHELTAFKACGVSLYRLAAPIFVVALLLSALMFAMDEKFLPETNRHQDAIRNEIKGRPVQTYLNPDRQWTFGQNNRIFFHGFFDSENDVLAGVNVYDLDADTFRLRRHIKADRAKWDVSANTWVFENGWVRVNPGHETSYEKFESRPFPDIEEGPSHFFKEEKQHRQMNWWELQAYIGDLTQAGFDTVKFQVQLHKKLAFPLFAFIMALLAVPFSMLAGHRGAFVGVVTCIGLAVAYYSLNAFFEGLGRHSQLSPAIAAWSPSLIFGLTGTYLFSRVRS